MFEKRGIKLLFGLAALLIMSMACLSSGNSGEAPQADGVQATTEALQATQAVLEAQVAEAEVVHEETQTAPEAPQSTISQWAVTAYASSEYGNPNYAATQATGAPDTLECGDTETAWASEDGYGVAWLEVGYAQPVTPTEIIIYQSHTPNQIVKVEIVDLNGSYHTVYTNTPQLTECPYENTIPVDFSGEINAVRITVDQSVITPPWDEIDAVALVGYPGSTSAAPSSETDPLPAPSTSADFKYSASDVSAGSFIYEIIGNDRDALIEGTTLQDQSVSDEYVFGLISDDMAYSLTFFLPPDLPQGVIDTPAYPSDSFKKSTNFAIVVRVFLYYPTGGQLMLEEHDDGTISGSFWFTAGREDDDTQVITVQGAFNHIQLPQLP